MSSGEKIIFSVYNLLQTEVLCDKYKYIRHCASNQWPNNHLSQRILYVSTAIGKKIEILINLTLTPVVDVIKLFWGKSGNSRFPLKP